MGEFRLEVLHPARHRDLAQAVRETGATEEDIRANSPYDGTSMNDFLYVPKVRAALKKSGFDGYLAWDTLSNDDVQVLVPFEKSQIKPKE